ncbi:MAG: family 20 glycosylhydrolase [Phycisphaeraceae bacterium]|nr:family 20 glycosylhydrolase [Phycisphaeraceae bacterium]
MRRSAWTIPSVSIACTVLFALPVAAMVPQPLRVTPMDGAFPLHAQTRILIDADDAPLQQVGQHLVDALAQLTGWTLQLGELATAQEIPADCILLSRREADAALSDEGYQMMVGPEGVVISAAQPAGLFYGVQSLIQMLPMGWDGIDSSAESLPLPSVIIEDSPRYAWRGLMLDVSRHFFDVNFIKKYIDLLALYKLNRFHWHLTDEPGWRIEIKKYPKLTEIGAWRTEPDGSRYGGFYTQEQIREIVAYAAARHITVVPEIDMPGHIISAIASYPELGYGDGETYEVAQIGKGRQPLNVGRPVVYQFVYDVLDEICELFPSPWIHIGGDEVVKRFWQDAPECQALMKQEGMENLDELQSYFIHKVEEHLNARGRRMIGWDEILQGGLAPNATVMSLRGIKGGLAAASMGHDVVMSPTDYCYIDYRQAEYETGFGKSTLTLEKVYSFDPTPAELDAEQAKHILGVQGNLWTERIATPQRAEYMALPRSCAIAEAGWSTMDRRDWADFQRRLEAQYRLLSVLRYEFRVPPPVGAEELGEFSEPITVDLRSPAAEGVVHFTTDGSEPTADSPVFDQPLTVTESLTIKAVTVLPNGRCSPVRPIELTRQP